MRAKSGKGRPLDKLCGCDLPTCKESWVCRELGKFKIIHDYLGGFADFDADGNAMWSVPDMIKHIEREWAKLIK